MATPVVLTLPGWHGSDAQHWQSRWEAHLGHRRVEQHDWDRPLRGDWIARLEDQLLHTTTPATPAVLVAHSLGCIQVAAWAAHSRHTGRVRAALLVAPPDTETEALRGPLPGWAPIPTGRLPFASLVVSSSNDPWCSPERSRALAAAWGARHVEIPHAGHLNTASGLGDWPQGQALLTDLMKD